jgi:hypothetical protein
MIQSAKCRSAARKARCWLSSKTYPIWENKRYRGTPVLCDGDGEISRYRVWVKQFNPKVEDVNQRG